MRYESSVQRSIAESPSQGSWSSRVFPGSRYEVIPVSRLPHRDKRVPAVLERFTPAVRYYAFYTVKGTERLDQIAQKYYSDPTLWWKIADANPEIFFPTPEPGSIIRVPLEP